MKYLVKTITLTDDDISITTSELTGAASIDQPYIHAALGDALLERYGVKRYADLSAASWQKVMKVTSAIQHIVSLSGDWPITLPGETSAAAYITFYDGLMNAPERYLRLISKAIDAVNAADDTPSADVHPGDASQAAAAAGLDSEVTP